MKNVTFMKNISLHSIARRMMAVLLVLALLSFVGCKDDKGDKTNGGTSSKPTVSSQTNTSSEAPSSEDADTSSEGSTTKNNTTSSSSIDPTLGDISFSATTISDQSRDDADEIIPVGNCANLSTDMVGGFEAEAEERRNEILNTPNTEEIYGDKMTGTKYYISPGGDNKNDGTSPETPFRTIEALYDVDLEKGDSVLFERGAVFRFLSSFNTVEGVIYGSYGEGEKPKIYGSPMNFAKCEWKPSSRKNIWRTNYVYDELCSVVFEHGEEIGYRKTSVRALSKNTDFYQDEAEGTMYIYCDKGNPSNVYDSIEVGTRFSLFLIPGHSGDVIIDNLCLKYNGLIGVEMHFNNHDVTVTNCEIGWIGGAVFGGGVRYGNAVQCWQGGQNITVCNNWIYQTFDAAFSWQGAGQGTPEKYNVVYSDIRVNDNLFEFNDVDIELWDANELLTGVHEYNRNIHRFTSLGWGTRGDDGGYRGLEGTFGNCTTGDMVLDTVIEVHDMIVDCPGREIFSWYIYGTGRNADMGADTWNYHDIRGIKAYVNLSYRTFNRALRGCRRVESDPKLTSYVDDESLIKALQRFDPNIEVTVVK